jgi:hypothetical protein
MCWQASSTTSKGSTTSPGRQGESSPATRGFWSQIVWPHFWALQIILLVIILDYCVIRELSRVLGEEPMLRIFVRRHAAGIAKGT